MENSENTTDLLDEELEKLRKSNRKKSYEQYLRDSYDGDASELYADALAEATRQRDLGRVGYGRLGESLSSLGLDRSGYSAYLAAQNERTYTGALDDAESAYRKEQQKRQRSYQSYLADYEREQSSKLSTGMRQMFSNSFDSADEAYRYGLAIGMDDERASLLRDLSAAYGAGTFRDGTLSNRIAILEAVSRGYMSYEQAYRYALALGAPEETAEQIARYAELGGSTGSLIDWAENIGS